MNIPQALIFFGPQGSGKGTQLENLTHQLASRSVPVTTIQTGEVFRSLAQTTTPAATQIKDCLAAGKFVPAAITNTLVIQTLMDQWAPEQRVVFDGYPRTQEQAATLLQVLEFFSCAGIAVLHLDVPDMVVEARMVERGRADDTPDLIKKRLELYHQETQPVLQFLSAQAGVTVHTIDGSGSIEEVEKLIVAKLFS